MVVTKVECTEEFMSRSNYASLTHQIADCTQKPCLMEERNYKFNFR